MKYPKIEILFKLLFLSLLIWGCKGKKAVTDSTQDDDSFRKIPTEIKEANKALTTSEPKKTEYFDLHYVRNIDHSYVSHVKTVLLYKGENKFSAPILNLGSSEMLTLKFDDLNAERKTYTYKIRHCNANWEPSDLAKQEYLTGFTTDLIERPESSENTHQEYTHYTFQFPNDNFKLTKSGNYLIHVLDGDSLLITKRFMILENRVGINVNIKAGTLIKDRDYKQEIDFVIRHPGYPILDPYKSLKVAIYQNRRHDNFKMGIQPNFVKNDELHYNYEDINVFEGGNEFRPLDLKNFEFNSSMVRDFVVESDRLFHAYLIDDEVRSYLVYTFTEDLNGKYLIKKDNVVDPNLESDYVMTHFSLPYDLPETTGDIYIIGQLADWQVTEDFKMTYNYESKKYEKSLLLKQGYYNYLYAFLQDRNKNAELSVIEGTHVETENEYSIFVYYREMGDNYDRLIGMTKVNSKNKN